MERTLVLTRLAQAERHIREGERHLLRQRQIVDELERHGRGQSQTAKMARDIWKHLKWRRQHILSIGRG